MLCSWPFLFSSHPVKTEQLSHEPAHILSWVSSKWDEINNSLGGEKEKYQPPVLALNDPLFLGFLISLSRKQLCQPVPLPFEGEGRNPPPPSTTLLSSEEVFLQQMSKWKSCEFICCFRIPPTHENCNNSSLGWVCTWVGGLFPTRSSSPPVGFGEGFSFLGFTCFFWKAEV